jgi:hypothetical protein
MTRTSFKNILALCAVISVATTTFTTAKTPAPAAKPPKADWPVKEPYDTAICAFDKALTKASRNKSFRARLTQSCDSAKKAVAEVGNINIPADRIIIFYEGEAVKAVPQDKRKEAHKLLGQSYSNEKIHVFVLPEWKNNDTAEYRYEEYFMGMYDAWLAHPPRCQVP